MSKPEFRTAFAGNSHDVAIGPAFPAVSHHPEYHLSISHYTSCYGRFTSPLDPGQWGVLAFLSRRSDVAAHDGGQRRPLYTAAERQRRDASPWTVVQGVLAPIQFAVFLISISLILRCLATGEGLALANASIVLKTFVLYTIMITGSVWEHEVFGRYLFARAFFWEDVFSILVLILHTAYLVALVTGALGGQDLLLLAVAAYAAYAVNATQFLVKLRAARRERSALGERETDTVRLAQ